MRFTSVRTVSAALESAATYRLYGHVLELPTATGALAVTLGRD